VNTASYCQYKWPNSTLSWHVLGQTPFGRMTVRRRQMLGGISESLYCLTSSSFILRWPVQCLRPTLIATSERWLYENRWAFALQQTTFGVLQRGNRQAYECYISRRRITAMRFSTQSANARNLWIWQLERRIFTPRSAWFHGLTRKLLNPVASCTIGDQQTQAYWRGFPLFVIDVRQMPGCSWKGQGRGSSSPITKPIS